MGNEPKKIPPTGPAILEAVKADYASIKIVVLTTIACVAVLIIPFAWLLTTLVSARTVDEKLGLSAFLTPKIMGEIAKKVDSGYSRSFILRGSAPTPDTSLLFYSEPGQIVRVVIEGDVYGPHPKIQVFIDKDLWLEEELPFHTHLANITEHVRSDAEGGDIHVMRVVPIGLTRESTAVLQCLVLVANR